MVLERRDPCGRRRYVKQTSHVVLTRAVGGNGLSKNGIKRFKWRLTTEQSADQRNQKNARADHCRNGVPRQAKAILQFSADVARTEEERLSGAHRDFIKVEFGACFLERRTDEIVIADRRATARHQDIGVASRRDEFIERGERIPRDPKEAGFAADRFDDGRESVGIRAGYLSGA